MGMSAVYPRYFELLFSAHFQGRGGDALIQTKINNFTWMSSVCCFLICTKQFLSAGDAGSREVYIDASIWGGIVRGKLYCNHVIESASVFLLCN